MLIDYRPPNEFDAKVEVCEGGLKIAPVFYSTKGSAVVGLFVTKDGAGSVLDRAVLSVSSNGLLSLSHKTAPVKPQADARTADDKTEETG